MTATDWQKLQQDAQETIDEIDVDKLNKNTYILLGASLGILNAQPAAGAPQDRFADIGKTIAEPAVQGEIEGLQDERSPLDIMMDESDCLYCEYRHNKSLELIHHSEPHGAIAENALRRMLKKDEEIMLALYRSADDQERQLIRESYERTLEQFK